MNICPKNRRKFRHDWDELAYLCEKIFYHVYLNRTKASAHHFAMRANVLVSRIGSDNEAILCQTANALLCEVSGEIGKAVGYRIAEIELIIKLYNTFNKDDDIEIINFSLAGRKKREQLFRLGLISKYYARLDRSAYLILSKAIDDIIGIDCPSEKYATTELD